MKPAPRIHVTIDRLVLNGVTPGQQHALVAALATELERRLASPGGVAALGGGRHLAELRPAAVRPRGTGPAALGIAAARGIEGALKR
jgi:hypothetical protein